MKTGSDNSQGHIVVIGSNSFSGSHFVRAALETGCTVVGISRSPEPDTVFLPYRTRTASAAAKRFTFHQLDLNKHSDEIARVIDDFRPRYVVNFAAQSMVAQSWNHPEQWYQTNVVGNVLLHDRLRHMKFIEKYVHVSTPEVYGNCEGTVTEKAPFNPSTPYAASRAACDLHLMTFFRNYAFPVVFTRAANVYGPGQQLYRIIPRTMLYARLGRKLPLHGGGHSVRSFIHITDVAEGTLRVMRNGIPPGVFHLATARFISIRDLVGLIAARLGVDFNNLVEISEDRPGKDSAYLLDTSLARAELAWKPGIELEDGLEDTLKWVDDNFDVLKTQSMEYIHKP